MCAKSQHAPLEGFFESPESNPPSRMLMIRAYLDESGHEQKEHVIIAGHAGDYAAWSRFHKEWTAALGVQRKRLHMNELRWTNRRTQKLLSELGCIPQRCGLMRVVGGVRVSDYEDLVNGTEIENLFKGYIPALLSAVTYLLLSTPKSERIEVVLEHQKEYSTNANHALAALSDQKDKRFLLADGTHRLARWAFVAKENEPLFDQADYLAYAVLQYCRDWTSIKAQWCAPILWGGRTLWGNP
jgi:hypothetical protein